MLKKLLYKILESKELTDKVEITGVSKGLQNVEFEGDNAVLSHCNFNGKIKVGYATTFSTHNYIHGDIEIGKYCQFGPFASINTFNHPTNHISTYINKRLLNGHLASFKTNKKTTIGNDVWIGKNAIILGGIKIGNGVIIAAGAVVNQDVPDYCVVGGVPAKVIKKRFSDAIVSELLDLKWWDKDENEIEKIKPMFDKDLSKLDSIYD